MSKKVAITIKQAQQFNTMLIGLKRIATYQTPAQLRKESQSQYGLDFEEAIEYAYENMQTEAKNWKKGIKPIQL